MLSDQARSTRRRDCEGNGSRFNTQDGAEDDAQGGMTGEEAVAILTSQEPLGPDALASIEDREATRAAPVVEGQFNAPDPVSFAWLRLRLGPCLGARTMMGRAGPIRARVPHRRDLDRRGSV